MSELANRLLAAARGLTVATAESCTDGMISAAITDVAGSSAIFGTGIVAHANAAKHRLLGVDPRMIEDHGAVSEAVAAAMAEGARWVAEADLAMAVTGIAGPDGGSAENPVGTVWFALAARGRETVTMRRMFPGDRGAVRRATVETALALLIKAVENLNQRRER